MGVASDPFFVLGTEGDAGKGEGERFEVVSCLFVLCKYFQLKVVFLIVCWNLNHILVTHTNQVFLLHTHILGTAT